MVYPDVPGNSLAFGNRAFVVVGSHGWFFDAFHYVMVVAVLVFAAVVGCERMECLIG